MYVPEKGRVTTWMLTVCKEVFTLAYFPELYLKTVQNWNSQVTISLMLGVYLWSGDGRYFDCQKKTEREKTYCHN